MKLKLRSMRAYSFIIFFMPFFSQPTTEIPCCIPQDKIRTANAQNLKNQKAFKTDVGQDKVIFIARNLKEQKLFNTILSDERIRNKNNKSGYYAFLTQKNDEGMTTLMIASALFDYRQIITMLDEVATYYGDKKTKEDKQQIFNFLDTRDPLGNSAFYFSTQNGDYKTIKAFMDRVPALLDDKDLFLKFLSAHVYNDKWTSLHWLTYDGALRPLKLLVQTAEKVLGKHSTLYDEFINAQNEDNGTALTYALTSDVRKFLIDHGATIIQQLDPEIAQAHALSQQFVEVMHDSAFGKMQKIMFQAQEKYKDKPDTFFEFITAKDESGWDMLMHAVGQGRYEYVAFILYSIEKFLHNKTQLIYDSLSSVSTEGQSPLIIAILRRNFDIAKLLIEKIKQYSKNKYLFYMIMNTTVYTKGLTPLLATVFFSSDKDEFYEVTKLILEVIAERFGKYSHTMDLFVNTRNYDGFTALSYASSEKLKKLLVDYGAHE
jgi:ankyrin repeat protein